MVTNHIPPTKHLHFLSCDDDLCTECLDCVYTCPEEAIMENNPSMTNLDDCTRCSTCINVCSEGAKSFTGDAYQQEMENALENFNERKDAEFYL